MEIISRKDAKEKGLKRYYTGNPCVNSHITERYTSSENCVQCASNRNKNYQENGYYRNYHYTRRYGISLKEYENLLEKQNGVCAICKAPNTDRRRYPYLHVDHCHSTGKVRGLLCPVCNKALGLFRDNTKILQRAINYITNKED